jgi:RHS repeat-associated protein
LSFSFFLPVGTSETLKLSHPGNRLSGSGEIIYRYNISGQRIYKKVGAGLSENYIMDGDILLCIMDGRGNIKYWNIIGTDISGRYEPGKKTKYYYLKDHLGSTRAVMDESGAVVEATDYYPFGLRMPGRSYLNGVPHAKEGFTGKETDSESGFIYFGARYYDPALGQWLAVDPKADKTSDITPYHFTHNNPVNKIDQDGKQDHFARVFMWAFAKQYPSTYRKIESGELSREIRATSIVVVDKTSTVLTIAGSYPSPASPYLLGGAVAFKGVAIAGKLKKGGGEVTQDVVGDVAGLIVGAKVPLAGEAVDFAIDNVQTIDAKVNPKYNIHSGPAKDPLKNELQQANSNQNSLDNLKPVSSHNSASSTKTQYQQDVEAWLKSKGF